MQGIFTALVTPFKNNRIDEESLINLIKWQVSKGVQGIVVCGTTGEGMTLTDYERELLISLCVEYADVPVIVGTSSNDTQRTIALTVQAENLGADYALIAPPYYNKPMQQGLYKHFFTIHENCRIPLILYNIPSRCAIDLTNDTLIRLLENCSRIVGIKDATKDLTRPLYLRTNITKPKKIYLFSGDDVTALPFNVQGGNGCISVTANIIPQECVKMHNAYFSGNLQDARKSNEYLFKLSKALFYETNPIMVKYALSLLKKCSSEMRLPLTLPSLHACKYLEKVMQQYNLLS